MKNPDKLMERRGMERNGMERSGEEPTRRLGLGTALPALLCRFFWFGSGF